MLSKKVLFTRKVASLDVDGYKTVPLMNIKTRCTVRINIYHGNVEVGHKTKLYYELFDKVLKKRFQCLQKNIVRFTSLRG